MRGERKEDVYEKEKEEKEEEENKEEVEKEGECKVKNGEKVKVCDNKAEG